MAVDGGGVERRLGFCIDVQISVPGIQVKAGPVAVIHAVVGDHRRECGNLPQIRLQLVGGYIVRVVIDLKQEFIAVCLVQTQGVFASLARHGVCVGAGVSQDLAAGAVEQGHAGHILVISGIYSQGISHHAQRNFLDFRRGVVNGGLHGPGSALAQGVPVHPIAVYIVLGSQGHGDFKSLTFCQLLGNPLELVALNGLQPCFKEQDDAIVGSIEAAEIDLLQLLSGGGIGDPDAAGGHISDGVELNGVHSVAVLVVDGVTLGHIGLIRDHRVATQAVGVAGIPGVLHHHAVDRVYAGVGSANLVAGGKLLGGADFKHGGICPVAIEAQHGDAVAGAVYSLGVCDSIGVHISLQVSAVGIMGIQICLFPGIQGQSHGYLDGAACRNVHSAAGQLGQEHVNIVGVHIFITGDISMLQAADGASCAGDIVQERLGVILVHIAVAVKVATLQSLGGADHGPICFPGGGAAQVPGCGVQVTDQHGVILGVCGFFIGVAFEGILGKHICGKLEGFLFIAEVVQVEGEGIHTSSGLPSGWPSTVT